MPLIDERLVTGPEASWGDIADGAYRVVIRAIDGDGLEGADASAALEVDARPEPPIAQAPVVDAVLFGDRAAFSWTRPAAATGFDLELAPAPGAAGAPPILSRDSLADTRLDAPLPPGRYTWRVRSRAARPDGTPDLGPWNEALTFTLKAMPPAGPRGQRRCREQDDARAALGGRPRRRSLPGPARPRRRLRASAGRLAGRRSAAVDRAPGAGALRRPHRHRQCRGHGRAVRTGAGVRRRTDPDPVVVVAARAARRHRRLPGGELMAIHWWRDRLGPIFAGLAVAATVGTTPVARQLDRWLGDLTAGLVAPALADAADGSIVFDVDDRTLGELTPLAGSWPYGRDVWAHVVDYLRVHQARGIVLDVLFAEPRTGDAQLSAALDRAPGTVIAAATVPFALTADTANATSMAGLGWRVPADAPAMAVGRCDGAAARAAPRRRHRRGDGAAGRRRRRPAGRAAPPRRQRGAAGDRPGRRWRAMPKAGAVPASTGRPARAAAARCGSATAPSPSTRRAAPSSGIRGRSTG